MDNYIVQVLENGLVTEQKDGFKSSKQAINWVYQQFCEKAETISKMVTTEHGTLMYEKVDGNTPKNMDNYSGYLIVLELDYKEVTKRLWRDFPIF